MIYTIGHSTRTSQELVELLRHYGVDRLIDIRSIPFSRYNPQFNRDVIADVMRQSDIGYEHLESLGGIKPTREVMERATSCSERSRGFATYMQSDEFRSGLARVLQVAEHATVALMCAESNPSHCHRFWVSDALLEQGVDVAHIIDATTLRDHPRNLFTYE